MFYNLLILTKIQSLPFRNLGGSKIVLLAKRDSVAKQIDSFATHTYTFFMINPLLNT